MAQRTLIVAEKPSVARDIARVLNAKTKREGFIENETHVITWALGHLVALCEPDEMNPEWKKWRMDQLPMLPDEMKTKVLPKTRAQYAVVKGFLLSPDISHIICATDSGREGELIFRYLYEKAKCKKPVQRLWISSMTDAAIREGFSRLKPSAEYDSLYVSARCRSEADWLVGMNASRAFTLKYNALLSIGRVQTPTLRLIVQRDQEIRAFVPQDYWEIRADFGDYQGLWLNPQKNETRCHDREQALAIKKATAGKTGAVTLSERERKKTPPPQLFDLTSLQREANKLLGLSAQTTLKIAQSLYEQRKLITYPRTDSRYLSRDMIPKIQTVLGQLPEPYAAFAASVKDHPPVTARMYNDAKVTDHHAIVPTGQKTNLSALSPEERGVFDMIARRLIAAHYPDYEYESALVLTVVNEHTFKTNGATPLVEGWRALYRDGEKEKEETVPNVRVGDARVAQTVSIKAQKTKPPAPLTDATLLAQMERAGKTIEDEELKESMKDSGLGTPATRAAIIERLIDVGYVQRKAKTLISTEKGEKLIAVAPEEIASPEMTGRWEKALSDMVKTKEPDALRQREERFMQGIRRFSTFLVESAKESAADVQFDREERTVRTRGGKRKVVKAPKVKALKVSCPVCGQGEVTENSKAFGCSRWKEGCRFTLWKNTLERAGGPALTGKIVEAILNGQSVDTPNGTILYRDHAVRFLRK